MLGNDPRRPHYKDIQIDLIRIDLDNIIFVKTVEIRITVMHQVVVIDHDGIRMTRSRLTV